MFKKFVLLGMFVGIAVYLFQSAKAPSSRIETPRAMLKSPSPAYSTLVDDVNIRVKSFEKLAAERPADWVVRERLAKILAERSSLTGRIEDLIRADKVLHEAFGIAPAGSGPLSIAAKVNYSMHRLGKVDEYLNKLSAQPILKAPAVASIVAMRANLAFHRGDYDRALEGYRKCEGLQRGACLTDLATYYANTGGYLEAESLFKQALSTTASDDAHNRAWLNLQLGILRMRQGRYEETLTFLREADRILPGWWLVREHIAETLMLRGETKEAVAIYEEVVRETGLPQYLDALAEAYRKLGRESEAAALETKSEKLWDEQLKLAPEAASGHAMEHYMGNPARAEFVLDLAKKNFEIRPGGEAKLFLAEAYLKNSKPQEAKKLVDELMTTRYESAELYDLASRIYSNLGDGNRSAELRQKCLEINPAFA